jgi:hypothetical protein
MDQDILKPEKTPATGSQAFSPLGCFIAAFGAALLTFCLLTAASAASIWAFAHLLGLSDSIARIFMLIGVIPPALASIWVAGRAWHVERRLAQHHDIDNPVFKLAHYLRRRPA